MSYIDIKCPSCKLYSDHRIDHVASALARPYTLSICEHCGERTPTRNWTATNPKDVLGPDISVEELLR